MMTPYQSAAFISSQIVMFQSELSLIHAQAYGTGGNNKLDTAAVVALQKKYEPVLNADAVKKLFEEVNLAHGPA